MLFVHLTLSSMTFIIGVELIQDRGQSRALVPPTELRFVQTTDSSKQIY